MRIILRWVFPILITATVANATEFYFGKTVNELLSLHSGCAVISRSAEGVTFRLPIGIGVYDVEYQLRNGVSVSVACGITRAGQTVADELDEFSAIVEALKTHGKVEETDFRLNGTFLCGELPGADDPPNYLRARGSWDAGYRFIVSLEGFRSDRSIRHAQVRRFGFRIIPRVSVGDAPM